MENPELELRGEAGGGCLLALPVFFFFFFFFFLNHGGLLLGPSPRSATVRCREGGYDRRTVQDVIISFPLILREEVTIFFFFF